VIARLVVLGLLLAPRAAWACATCVSSAYGDRTFNWAFLGLLLMPFVVATGIAGVLAARYYAPFRRFLAPFRRFLAPPWRSRSSGSAVAGAAQLAPHEESSL
jgi:hypothetical protein